MLVRCKKCGTFVDPLNDNCPKCGSPIIFTDEEKKLFETEQRNANQSDFNFDRSSANNTNKNIVAQILKIYAIVNAVAGLLISLSMHDSYVDLIESLSFVFFGLSIVVSFGIYAFGEVIQLLQDIKDGTQGTMNSISKNINNNSSEDLPNI